MAGPKSHLLGVSSFLLVALVIFRALFGGLFCFFTLRTDRRRWAASDCDGNSTRGLTPKKKNYDWFCSERPCSVLLWNLTLSLWLRVSPLWRWGRWFWDPTEKTWGFVNRTAVMFRQKSSFSLRKALSTLRKQKTTTRSREFVNQSLNTSRSSQWDAKTIFACLFGLITQTLSEGVSAKELRIIYHWSAWVVTDHQ